MSYRKITVNDTRYEYVIGRTNTRIRGLKPKEIFLNSEIGTRADPLAEKKFNNRAPLYQVTPAVIRALILGLNPQGMLHTCKHGTATIRTAGDPYESEVNDQYVPMIDCPLCLDERYMET